MDKSLYLISNTLQVAASTISFFLVYYFVRSLQFSLLQAGLLMSFYGLGIFLALTLQSYINSPKIILLLNTIVIGNFLLMTSFLPLLFNITLFGFTGALLKHRLQPLSQKGYLSSNVGLGLAMLSILVFELKDLKILVMASMILNGLPLFFLPRPIGRKFTSATTTNSLLSVRKLVFYLSLLFLGGLLLAQLTISYGIYLASQFPRLGLSALAIFLLLHLSIVCLLQKPLLGAFYRMDTLLKGGCGALLLGLGCYSLDFGHLFSAVIFSAVIYSVGEIFFISALHKIYHENHLPQFFSKTLALSFIIGASLSTFVYQYFGAHTLWQGCALVGVLCFGLGLGKLKAIPVLLRPKNVNSV